MRLKGAVMELLNRRDIDGLEHMVVEQPRAVQPLLGRLWDPDPTTSGLAARAIGAAGAAHPELGTELLRRVMWALNDESATNGAPMLQLVGEIGRRAPELVAPFIGPVTAYLWDESLRGDILAALCAVAEVAPELVSGVRGRLSELEGIDEPGERACLDRLLAVIREGVDGR